MAENLDNPVGKTVLAAAFHQSPLALVVVADGGVIAAVSDGTCELLGAGAEVLVGRSVVDCFSPPLPITRCLALDECQDEHCRREMLPPQGDPIPVEILCRPFRGKQDGGFDHCLLYISDTRKRDYEDEVRVARLAKLSLLNQVSEALYGANLTLDQVLEAVLICITAGQGLRFNRAFLLLVDEKATILKGEIAIGPSDQDEAGRIWHDLSNQSDDLFSMMTSYDQSLKQTDAAVNAIVKNMVVPLNDLDNVLVRCMEDRQAISITAEMDVPGVAAIRTWLGCDHFAVAPLVTRSGMLGAIIADNAISRQAITDLDLEFLQLFANQSSSAIENSRLYAELEHQLIALRMAHQKLKEHQDTLLRMERLSVMGETSAIVAHELRNPLVAIGGFARALVRNLDAEDPNHKYAAIITEEVTRMETIIHDLLDFIRPQKQRRKDIVIDDLVTATVDRFQGEMQAKEVELSLSLASAGVVVSCNPIEIQQVLQNFLMNSLQVMPNGGSIEVRTWLMEGGVQVEVCDSGPGFADDVEDKLFAPFFTTKPTGSGLGLTICHQIIKSHGGVVGARNRQGKGAGFSFILPLPKNP